MKNQFIIYISLLILILFFTTSCEENNLFEGCTDIEACNYDSQANSDDNSCEYPELGYDCENNITEYIIGMEAQGGIIFYLDESGQHGLVSAKSDIGIAQWGCLYENVKGAEGYGIGTGYQNTIDIINGCQIPQLKFGEQHYAAFKTLEYELNGYDDWYLPSLDELKSIFSMRDIIGNFSDVKYWSSTECTELSSIVETTDKAWGIHGTVGEVHFFNKNESNRVRPIRSF